MATFDYGRAASTARRLIGYFGSAVSIRRVSVSGLAYDPTRSTTDTASVGVRVNMRHQYIASGAVEATDRMYYVRAGDTVPEVGDQISLNGEAFRRVKMVTPLSPAGEDVYYEVVAEA